jgi:ssrA-binding protein
VSLFEHSGSTNTVANIVNRKALFDYYIEEKHEAGLVLEGWEVKSIREGRAQIKEAHVIIRGGELFLLNAHITPLKTASTHTKPDPTRLRKLLMHSREINKLIGKVERAGYALIPLDMHFTRGRVKLTVALAKGKRQYEKRADESKKQWDRDRERLMKKASR